MSDTTTHCPNNETADGGIGAAATPGTHTTVIRSVSIRVAGPIVTEAFAHHFGTDAQQVGVRAGDTLSYVTGHAVAAAIARVFSDAVALAERHDLRHSVSATWLGVEPGTYPPSLLQRHTAVPATACGFQPRRTISGTVIPAHVWVRVGPVLWQVCDRLAADRLAHVWSSCARMLATRAAAARPTRPANRRPAWPAVESAALSTTEESTSVRPQTPAATTTDPRGDAELLAAYAGGDRDALAVLVVRSTPLVLASARRVLGARGEVEDVVQEVWANVARSAHRFEGRAAVSTWLWRMARNAAITVLRGQRPVVGEAFDIAAPGDDYRDADDAITVRELLAVLPVAQRAAVELVDLQGRDIASAAQLLGVAEGTVKSRCQRGRAAMAVEAARREVHEAR